MADQPVPRPAGAAGRTPRRHHFIPQFYLAGFTDSGQKDGSLWILSREDGRRWRGTPDTVAHQRDFYRVDDVEGVAPDAFEKGFATFEGQAAETLSRVLAEERLPAEATDDFEILVNFVALMVARVPATRTALAQPLEMLARMLADTMVVTPERYRAAVENARRSGVDVPDVDYATMREFVREHMVLAIPQGGHIKQLFQAIDILLPLLAGRKWSLLIAEEGAGDFITSDDPVALTWTSTPALPGMEPPGFGLMKTDVTFPLSKKLALLGRFEGDAGRFSADRSRVAAINTRTGMYCVRFLCSPGQEFFWLKADGTVKDAADLVQEIAAEAARR